MFCNYSDYKSDLEDTFDFDPDPRPRSPTPTPLIIKKRGGQTQLLTVIPG